MQKAPLELNHEFRQSLQEEYARRLRVNERYSLRAFAVHLGLHSSTLSQLLAGKRQFSVPKIAGLCERLGLPLPKHRAGRSALPAFSQLSLDRFALIADWYHYALLDLTQVRDFVPRPEWIAHKLSITVAQAKAALQRLLRLELLVREAGTLRKARVYLTNYAEGVTSVALKEYQRQILRMAMRAIDDCPAAQKDITSMTVAFDARKLPLAKEKIKKFRRELCAFLEEGEKDSVFHLAIQLYPVTQFGEKNELK